MHFNIIIIPFYCWTHLARSHKSNQIFDPLGTATGFQDIVLERIVALYPENYQQMNVFAIFFVSLDVFCLASLD